MASRNQVWTNMCINNLRQIKLAKEQWATDNNKMSADTPTAANLDTYIKDGTSSFYCPLDPNKGSVDTRFGTSYTINDIGHFPACKISSSNHKL